MFIIRDSEILKMYLLAFIGFMHDVHIIYFISLTTFSFLLDYKFPKSKWLILICWVSLYRTEICSKTFPG